jgi:hypothetical protein
MLHFGNIGARCDDERRHEHESGRRADVRIKGIVLDGAALGILQG